MRYRRLGRAGLRLSELSLGTWLTYGESIDARGARACVRRAFDLGIRSFDTADVYAGGRAEEVLGKCLAEHSRADYVLATKCGHPTGPGPNARGLSRKHVIESCDASLRRLGVDYVDLYQAHVFDFDVELEEVLSAMDTLVRQGKTLYWGTSNWSGLALAESVESSRTLGWTSQVSEQPCYNLLDRGLEGDRLTAARRYGLGFLVYSPLAQGMLTGKYVGGARPRGARAFDDRLNQFMGRFLGEDAHTKVGRFVALAGESGVEPAVLALAWCLRVPEVTSVIIGASAPEQIERNVAASGFEIGAEILEGIEAIFAPRGSEHPA